MPVVRAPLTEGEQFLRARNDVIRNYKLSRGARITLLDMLSEPDDWHFDQTRVGKRNGMGRDLTRKVFQELEDAGYLRQEPIRNGQRWGGVRWTVYDTPQASEVQRTGGRFAKTAASPSEVTPLRAPDTDNLSGSEVTPFTAHGSGDAFHVTSLRSPETRRTYELPKTNYRRRTTEHNSSGCAARAQQRGVRGVDRGRRHLSGSAHPRRHLSVPS